MSAPQEDSEHPTPTPHPALAPRRAAPRRAELRCAGEKRRRPVAEGQLINCANHLSADCCLRLLKHWSARASKCNYKAAANVYGARPREQRENARVSN